MIPGTKSDFVFWRRMSEVEERTSEKVAEGEGGSEGGKEWASDKEVEEEKEREREKAEEGEEGEEGEGEEEEEEKVARVYRSEIVSVLCELERREICDLVHDVHTHFIAPIQHEVLTHTQYIHTRTFTHTSIHSRIHTHPRTHSKHTRTHMHSHMHFNVHTVTLTPTHTHTHSDSYIHPHTVQRMSLDVHSFLQIRMREKGRPREKWPYEGTLRGANTHTRTHICTRTRTNQCIVLASSFTLNHVHAHLSPFCPLPPLSRTRFLSLFLPPSLFLLLSLC